MLLSTLRIYLCKVQGTVPDDVKKLFGEFDLARDLIVQSRPDILDAVLKAGRPNPELTTFSYILCEQEDKALQIMEDTASRLGIRRFSKSIVFFMCCPDA